MTKVTIDFENELFKSFEVSGHANYSTYGSDIVCSGITVACFTTIGLLKKVLKSNSYEYSEKDAFLSFKMIDLSDHLTNLIISNFIEVLENIQKQYPKHLKIKIAKK